MSGKQYPPQTGRYLVKVKSGQSTDQWQNFAAARLPISVGQPYHEGEKFACLIAWCQARFAKLTVCANDTLQRFNLMFEQQLDEERAERIASDLGRAWVRRTLPVISGVDHAKIIRWDAWKTRKEFTQGRLSVEWLYANNDEFKAAIDRNITDIWQRRKKVRPDLYQPQHFPRFHDLSRRYLLEETAAFATMFAAERAIDIYPGTTLFAATLFRGRTVPGAPAGLGKGHFCRVDFSHNKNYQSASLD